MIQFFVIFLLILTHTIATAQSIKIDNHTVDIYVRQSTGPTIVYVPGCSGLDDWGKKYQKFHIEQFTHLWPTAHLVVSQYVNDVTNGSANGRCDWPLTDPRVHQHASWIQAAHTIKISEWVKQQSWSNSEVHLFAFSWGGRVGIWVPASKIGYKGAFNTVALVWPDCRPSEKIQAGLLHTPTRIYATENDPLSIPKNCPTYYSDPNQKLSLFLFPGNTHSWFSFPGFKPYYRWWPVQQVWVHHEFNANWTATTFNDWKQWALKTTKPY